MYNLETYIYIYTYNWIQWMGFEGKIKVLI